MGCQAVSDGRESKTIEKYKQESFELSPNIDRYKKKAYKFCTIRLQHLDVVLRFHTLSVFCQWYTGTSPIAVTQLYHCFQGKLGYDMHDLYVLVQASLKAGTPCVKT